MSEKVVSLKLAKLAKRKGFKERTTFAYGDIKERILYNYHHGDEELVPGRYNELLTTDYDEDKILKYPAPTLSQLQTWLRVTHKIHVEPKLNESLFKRLYESSHKVTCLKWRWSVFCNIDDVGYIYESFNSKDTYSTYEDALEEGLLKAIELCQIITK